MVYNGLLNLGSESIEVAIKKYRIGRMSSRCQKQIESEAAYLSKLHHPNIIKYYGTCLDEKAIIMERMGMTLNNDPKCVVMNLREYIDELMDNATNIEPYQKIKLALDAAKGIEYLHKNNIVHRDIKSRHNNLLIKEDVRNGITLKVT